METPIKKAIKEGYEYKRIGDMYVDPYLDPLFWQALGKACGWRMEDPFNRENTGDRKEAWLHYWHRFIDALSEGRTADDFFKELLK